MASILRTGKFIKTDQTLERSLKRWDNDVRRVGRISQREEILEEIRSHNKIIQYILVIRCCGNLVAEELTEIRTALSSRNLENIKYIESTYDLESKGIEPNRVTYQQLISRFCQQGDIEGATRILEFMREKGLPVNENVFNALILGHSEANDMESAAAILGLMKQAGLEPSADTYSTLIHC